MTIKPHALPPTLISATWIPERRLLYWGDRILDIIGCAGFQARQGQAHVDPDIVGCREQPGAQQLLQVRLLLRGRGAYESDRRALAKPVLPPRVLPGRD